MSETYEIGDETLARLTAANIEVADVARAGQTGSISIQYDIDIMEGFNKSGYLKAEFNVKNVGTQSGEQKYELKVKKLLVTFPDLNKLRDPMARRFIDEVRARKLTITIKDEDLGSKEKAVQAIKKQLELKTISVLK